MKIFWTPEALNDRRAIYDYIEVDSPSAAFDLDALLAQSAAHLAQYPDMGRPGRVNGTRELVAHRSYVIVYDISNDSVRVLRVLHTARRWPPARQQ